MKKVNIREALLDMDKQTYCQYDLYTLYEACNLQECDKKEIAKMISDDKSPEEIYDKLVDKFSDSVTTTDDDDISDVKESFGDDLIDSQYQDDTSDGHWSWDYDDDELANIYGGDTKYDNHPGGLDMDEYDLDESTKGFIRSYCDECGKMNRVEVEFKDFNKPFEDTIYTCSHCGAKNLLTDPHEYNNDGTIKESATDPRYYKMVEYVYDGDNVSDYLGHVRVRTNSDKVALRAAEKYAMSKHSEDSPRHFKIVDDNYTNVDVIDSDGDYLTTLESIDESKSIKESLNEGAQLKLFDDDMIDDIEILHQWRPEEVEEILVKHGSSPNNDNWIAGLDLPAAYDEIMTTFRDKYSDYDEIDYSVAKVLGLVDESLKEESSNKGWVKRWNFLDNYYKGDLVISKISSPVDAWHVEKVAPNGHTIKHLGNYKSLEVAMDAAEKHLIKNESKSIKESNKIAYGNEKYKGYMIRQDRKYGGYNVYDKEDEMEDSGFTTIDKAKEFIDSLEESKSIKEDLSSEKIDLLFKELNILRNKYSYTEYKDNIFGDSKKVKQPVVYKNTTKNGRNIKYVFNGYNRNCSEDFANDVRALIDSLDLSSIITVEEWSARSYTGPHNDVKINIDESKLTKTNESKSIKEDVEVIYQKGNKKIVKDGYGYAIDDGINANRFYVTDDGKPKFDDGCSSKFWLDKVNSLIKAGKLTSRKNESKSIKEDMNDSDEILTFKRDVNLANDADEIQLLIYELSDGVAEDNAQQAFNENESNDLETLKSAVITAIDVYLEDNEWLGESKSIKEGMTPSQSTLDDCLQDYRANAFGFDGVEDYVETNYPSHPQEFKDAVIAYLKKQNEGFEEDKWSDDELDTLNESAPLKKVETAVEKLGGRVINTEPENNLVEICSPSETLDDEWISQLKSEIDNIDSIDSVDIDEQTFYKYEKDIYSGRLQHVAYEGYNLFISLTPSKESSLENESLKKSKSIKESSLVDKKVSTLGKRGKPMYFTADQLEDAKSKYPEYDFEETTIEYSLPAEQKAYIARRKTNESKYTSNLIGPDSLLMNAEEAYFDDNLGDFVADALNDCSATEEELLAVTEKSSFIEYDDMLNAIDYAKSLNESFDISWNGNKIATSANKNLCESIVKKALKASSTPDLVIESAGKNVTNKFIRSIVESQDIHEGTSLKRIARYNEFDNGNVLHNYEKMTSEEAEERAKQASLDNPDDIYYVAYDDIMDSSSDLRWINGKSYNYSDVQIKGGKPYIKDTSANESIEDISIEDIDKFVAEVKEKFPGSEAIYDGDTNTIKITLDNVQKENLTEDSIESDELETADQKISSANTSINSSKLPAIFRLVKFEPDTLNLDYGGGKFDNAAEYLAQQNVTNLVYDPYNRSTQHNAEVLQKVRENGGADTITISNVLNVIAEPEARLTVLRNAKKLVKPGGNVYITVYEGNKSGEGTETKSGYQLNKSTADYIDEIASVFSTVNRKGKLIIAK